MRTRTDRTGRGLSARGRRPADRPCRIAAAFRLLLAASLIGMLTGCGGETDPFERVPVEGVVTVDGSPLSRGTIRFIPEGTTEGPKVALPVVDGSFSGDRSVGPVAGKHQVVVEPEESDEFPHDGEEVLEQLAEEGRRRRAPAAKSPPSTPHTFVAGETNEVRFDL